MNTETFQSMCERQAIKHYATKTNWTEDTVKDKVDELADQLASKCDDYLFFYEIAHTAVTSVFNNPDRYSRLIKTPIDPLKMKKQIDSMVA